MIGGVGVKLPIVGGMGCVLSFSFSGVGLISGLFGVGLLFSGGSVLSFGGGGGSGLGLILICFVCVVVLLAASLSLMASLYSSPASYLARLTVWLTLICVMQGCVLV